MISQLKESLRLVRAHNKAYKYWLKQEIELPFLPYQFVIEPTNYCNMKCLKCPHGYGFDREKGYMEMELYNKIIEQIEPHCINLYFMFGGESMLHKQLSEMIKLAKQKGIKRTFLATNGTLLNKQNIPAILDSGLDNLVISFDGDNKQINQKLQRGANFYEILDNTINFLKDLFKKNGICTLIYKNTKITPHKGIIGIYTTPDPEFRYAGISFLIQKQIFNVIGEYIAEELKEKTQKVLKILEYEIKHGEQPSNKEIIRLFDINIDEIEEYERLINELPFESFSDNQDIKNNASEAIKQIDEPSLYDLLKTLQFDIETARMVGKYLIDSKMINELSRVPIEITSKTSLKPASESLKYKEIICNNCRTPLSDRENPEFCPYCGSSLS